MEPGHPGCDNCIHTEDDDDDEYLAALEASRVAQPVVAPDARASSPWGNFSDSGQSEFEALRDSTLTMLADLDRISPAPPSAGSPYLDANGREMLSVVCTSIAHLRSETPDSLFDEHSDDEDAPSDADATLRDAPLLTFSGSDSDSPQPNQPPPRIKIEQVDIDLTLDDSDDDDAVPPPPRAPPRRQDTPRRQVKIERVDIDLTLDDEEDTVAV